MFNQLALTIFGPPEGPTVNPAYQYLQPIPENPWKDLSTNDLLDICMAFDLSMSEASAIEAFIKRKQGK